MCSLISVKQGTFHTDLSTQTSCQIFHVKDAINSTVNHTGQRNAAALPCTVCVETFKHLPLDTDDWRSHSSCFFRWKLMKIKNRLISVFWFIWFGGKLPFKLQWMEPKQRWTHPKKGKCWVHFAPLGSNTEKERNRTTDLDVFLF